VILKLSILLPIVSNVCTDVQITLVNSSAVVQVYSTSGCATSC